VSNLLHGLMGEAQALLVGFIIIVAIVGVVTTWLTTRALVPVIGALLFGALVVFGVANFTVFSNEIGEDIDDNRGGDQTPIGGDVDELTP
jgi:hypothetical protein